MVCQNCQSNAVTLLPAEVWFYRDSPHIFNHPAITPQPDILVCPDCGWAGFSIPRSWLSAGLLRSLHPEPATMDFGDEPISISAATR